MTAPLLTVLGGLVGAVITGGAAVYLGRRSRSGSVRTSEATDLWESMRSELARLQAEAIAMRTDAATGRLETTALRADLRLMDAELRSCHDSSTLLARVAALEAG